LGMGGGEGRVEMGRENTAWGRGLAVAASPPQIAGSPGKRRRRGSGGAWAGAAA